MPEITSDYVWIPVRDAGLFIDTSFRNITLSEEQGIHTRIGKLISDPSANTVIQSYYFDKEKWTMASAKAWVADHKRARTSSTQIRTGAGAAGLDYNAGPAHIIGYAAVFNTPTVLSEGFSEKIMPGAFAESIQNDDIRATLNHDNNFILGRNRAKTLILREDDRGLRYEVVVPETSWAKDLVISIKRGDVNQSSFKFDILQRERVANEAGTLQILKRVRLHDVAVVADPAYPSTTAEVHARMIQSEDGGFWYFEDSEELIASAHVEPEKESEAEIFRRFEEVKKTLFV